MFNKSIIAIVFVSFFSYTSMALAQESESDEDQGSAAASHMQCGKMETILSKLKKQYGENPVFMGSIQPEDKNMYEMITLNSETKSWTSLMISLDKQVACLVSGGKVSSNLLLKNQPAAASPEAEDD